MQDRCVDFVKKVAALESVPGQFRNYLIEEAKRILKRAVMMEFSEALEVIKSGRKVQRASKPEEFLYLVRGSQFTVNRPPLNAMYKEGTVINYRPHIDIKLADGSCSVWSPSNEDILADDYVEIM